ncbi:MAG: hypothetical protein ACI8UZ_002605 [Akkermansiaceae bacterium]
MDYLIQGALKGDLVRAAQLIPNLTNPDQQKSALLIMGQRMFQPNNEGKVPEGSIDWIRGLRDSTLLILWSIPNPLPTKTGVSQILMRGSIAVGKTSFGRFIADHIMLTIHLKYSLRLIQND